MNEERLKRGLREARIPDQDAAAERGLRVVMAAGTGTGGDARPRRRGVRRALQATAAVALVAVLVSPAGASVRHWVRDAVETGAPPALPALTSLPTQGRLLVDSPTGPWVVQPDGSKRLLGPYEESTWSPRGLFVAATEPNELAAVEPDGTVHWTLTRPGPVHDPAWSSDGERIAYLDGDDLRVVAGDGTGDRLLATGVRAVRPAWQPGPGRRLAYVDGAGRVRVIEVDTGRLRTEAVGLAPVKSLGWRRDGSSLIVLAAEGVAVIAPDDGVSWRAAPPAGSAFVSAASVPDGGVAAVAVSSTGRSSRLLLLGEGGRRQQLFSGFGRLDQVVGSPDGDWLLATWRSADQWLFLSPGHPRRVVAIANISAQFNPGATSASAFPRVEGWCCPGE